MFHENAGFVSVTRNNYVTYSETPGHSENLTEGYELVYLRDILNTMFTTCNQNTLQDINWTPDYCV